MDNQNLDKTEAHTETHKINDAFVVHRSLRIPRMQSPEAVKIIQDCLAELKGVLKTEVNISQTQLMISYDAAQIGFGAIEKKMNDAGYPLANSWWSRFKSGWYRYLDENAQTNAKSKGGACCSNPSDIYANRRK